MIRLGNNEVLKTLTKTLTFVDTNAAAAAGGSTTALRECCSDELKTNQTFYICKYNKKKYGSSNLIGWQLEVGMVSSFIQHGKG